jgi:hypothetical protein
VWQPEGSLVGADFTPYYTGGHWTLTEFGWTWVSDFSWGWAPFHYGRWIAVSGYGWCWVPGTIWGPAWVAWRAGDGYVGWAALPPRGVSVTATYGPRSPWRFSRAADLNAPRPRCLPARDERGMFHRTTLVTNDRVLTREGATVHINAGPRHVNSAVPVRLTAVAPQAFPQRAILPRHGATMSARPWIRAATGGGSPANNGATGRPPGAGALVDPSAGRAAGRTPTFGRAPARLVPSSPYASPHVYNPPRPVAPSARASNQPTFANTAPHIYNAATVNGGPHIYNPPAAGNGTHVYNPPTASSAPRIYNPAPATPAPHTYGQPATYDPPHAFGGSPARVYNPPPRAFPSSAAVNPPRAFSAPVQHAPAPPAHQTFAAPVHAMPPSHGFSAPAASGWSGHAGGGGAPLGGGHRR